jgi:hypothetical protein
MITFVSVTPRNCNEKLVDFVVVFFTKDSFFYVMLRKYRVEDARVLRNAFVANICCFGGFDLSLERQKKILGVERRVVQLQTTDTGWQKVTEPNFP